MASNLIERYIGRREKELALAWTDHEGKVLNFLGGWAHFGCPLIREGRMIEEDLAALVGFFPMSRKTDAVCLPMIAFREGSYMEISLDADSDGVLLSINDVSEIGRFQREILQNRHELALAKAALDLVAEEHAHALEALRRYHMIFEHEVRNAAQNIYASLEFYRRSAAKPEANPHFRSALASAEAMTATINAALDVEKIQQGAQDHKLVPARLVHDLAAEFRPLALLKGLDLKARSEAGTERAISLDPFRLRLILINLIGNAIKFSSEGDILLEAFLDGKNPSCLSLVVSDHGPGFDEGEPTRTQGSGLGLYICHQLVRALKGVISLEPNRPRGTRVRLDFRVG